MRVEFDKMATDAIDKLRDATEEGKLPRGVRDLLEAKLEAEEFQSTSDRIRERADEVREEIEELEAKATRLEEKADAVATVADAVSEALSKVDEWEGAEGRDEKTDARETLLDSLASIVEAFDDLPDDDEDDDDLDLDADTRLALAKAERAVHAAVGAWLESTEAELYPLLPDDGPPAMLKLAVQHIISDHRYRGELPVRGE